MDALDIYLDALELGGVDNLRRSHGDRYLLKTPEGDPAQWDASMGFATVVVPIDETEAPGTLDHQPDFSSRWGVIKVVKNPDNPFPDRISVGRARSCDVVLRLSFVSKLHAHFLTASEDGLLRLVDQNSANGTSVNERRLTPSEPAVVLVGDRIGFGPNFELVYLDAAALARRLEV